MIHKTLFRGLLALAAAGLVAGCTKDSSMTAPSPAANVSLGAEVVHQLAKVSHPGLVIDTTKVLVRRIKFHQAGSKDPADVKSDSFVLRLVPGVPVSEVAVARIAPGSYDRLTFDIHKPEDLEILPDPEFRDGSSGNQRYSMIIKGSYNDSAFVYRYHSEFTVEFELQTPLTVSDDGITRITSPSIRSPALVITGSSSIRETRPMRPRSNRPSRGPSSRRSATMTATANRTDTDSEQHAGSRFPTTIIPIDRRLHDQKHGFL